MVRVLVSVCTGSEEIETITPVDLLRRAGAEVVLAASGDNLLLTLSRGIRIQADSLLSAVQPEDWDMIVVPGGPGAHHLRDDQHFIDILKHQKQADRWIASICASPVVVLQTHGLLEGITATCYPALAQQLPGRSEERVVTHGKIITSQGAGTSVEFALQLVRVLFGEQKERELAASIVAHC